MQFYNYKTEYLFISWLSKHLDILIFIQYHIWGPISEEIDQSKNTHSYKNYVSNSKLLIH